VTQKTDTMKGSKIENNMSTSKKLKQRNLNFITEKFLIFSRLHLTSMTLCCQVMGNKNLLY